MSGRRTGDQTLLGNLINRILFFFYKFSGLVINVEFLFYIFPVYRLLIHSISILPYSQSGLTLIKKIAKFHIFKGAFRELLKKISQMNCAVVKIIRPKLPKTTEISRNRLLPKLPKLCEILRNF